MKYTNILSASLMLTCALGAVTTNAWGFDFDSVACVQHVSDPNCITDTIVGDHGCFNSLVCKSVVSYINTSGMSETAVFSGAACFGTHFSVTSAALADLDSELGPINLIQKCRIQARVSQLINVDNETSDN